jgi:signal transduction histidine kinase
MISEMMTKTFLSLERLTVLNSSFVTATPFWAAWQKRSPTDLMLVLEWLLIIGATMTSVLLPLPLQGRSDIPFGASIDLGPLALEPLVPIGIFALMGLKRTQPHLPGKILYTLAEFGIAYLPSLLDPRLFFPPFYLIIVIRSCSLFGNLGQLATVISANFLFIMSLFSPRFRFIFPESAVNPRQFPNTMLTAQLNAMFAFLLISSFVLLLTNALFFMQRSRQELTEAHHRLRQYALRIEDQATLQERTRIAREMHDALGHTLTAQCLQLDTVHCFWNSDPDKALRSVSEAKQLSTQALKEVRQAIAMLRADPLQGLTLEGAIAKLVQTFHHTTGILPSCTLRVAMVPPPIVNSCVYRIVQEALTNIAKHSHATEVSIYLQTTPKQLNILIQDNGIGFTPSQNITGFGLQGMEERTLALDGLFSVVSQVGLGCKIMAQIPLTESYRLSSPQVSHDSSAVGG